MNPQQGVDGALLLLGKVLDMGEEVLFYRHSFGSLWIIKTATHKLSGVLDLARQLLPE